MKVCLAVLAIWCALAAPALAQETAAELAQRGVELGKQGKYAEAADAFKKAFVLEPRASVLCNLGMAHYGANDFARAHLYLTRCFRMAGAPVAGMVKPLEFATAQLDASDLARTEITSSPAGAEVAIDSLAAELRFTTPLVVYLPPGSHGVELSLEGHQPARQTVDVQAKTAQRLVITLVAEPEPTPEPTPEPGPTPEPEPIRRPPPPEPGPVESRWRRTPALVLSGVAVVALGVAIGARVQAGRLNDSELTDVVEGPEYDRGRDRVERWYHSSLALFGVSAALAATSAVLFALPVDDGAASIAVVPGRDGALLQVSLSR